jgi:hypothetical protein
MSKLVITFKDPDGVFEAIKQYVDDTYKNSDELTKLALEFDTERELKKWIEYGEYVSIEFDLDEGTAEVVPNR